MNKMASPLASTGRVSPLALASLIRSRSMVHAPRHPQPAGFPGLSLLLALGLFLAGCSRHDHPEGPRPPAAGPPASTPVAPPETPAAPAGTSTGAPAAGKRLLAHAKSTEWE